MTGRKYYAIDTDRYMKGALNAAKGNLRTQIHRETYKVRQFLTSSCLCKKDGLFAYEQALEKTNVWPLEEHLTGRAQKSVKEVLDGLQGFDYKRPNAACPLCSSNFNAQISAAVRRLRHSFDGLCLECLDEHQCAFVKTPEIRDAEANIRVTESETGMRITSIMRLALMISATMGTARSTMANPPGISPGSAESKWKTLMRRQESLRE